MNALEELQAAYGASCARYEDKATRKLGVKPSTIIVSGYGCSLSVRNNALRLYPGKTHKDQEQDVSYFYRGVHGVKQIILMNNKGTITFDAIQFCKDQDILVTLLDNRGNMVQSLTSADRSNIMLRRAQYAARDNGGAERIAYELIQRKAQEQWKTLCNIPELNNSCDFAIFTNLTFCNIPELRTKEASMAKTYFEAWYGLPIRMDKSLQKSVPPHWLYITERTSPLSKNHGARYAVNPFHAMLNYAYAILESQCKQALNIHGFDITCGFLHADSLHRDSLTYDLMEVHRPAIDRLTLKLLNNTKFHKGDFMSTHDGTVEFNPQVSRYVAATCRLPQSEIDASASWLQSMLS